MSDNKGIHIVVIKETEDEARAICKMIEDKYEVDIQYVTLAMLTNDMEDAQYQLEISMKKIEG
jgi:hypothetical protein